MNLVKSSMKIMKYLKPTLDKIGEGPQTSEWIMSKGFELLCSTKANGILASLPNKQDSHLTLDLEGSDGKAFSLKTCFTVRLLGSPRRECHKEKDGVVAVKAANVEGKRYRPCSFTPFRSSCLVF